MKNSILFTSEIWNKPAWIGIFSVTVSLFLYFSYAKLIGLEDYEDGILPAIIIPAVVGPTCSIFIGRYVRKIKEQNLKLVEMNSTNKNLLSIIAHDVRQPLLSIKQYLELQKMETMDRYEIKTLAKKLGNQVDNVLRLQDEILNWSKSQTAAEGNACEFFNVNPSISQIIALYEDFLESKKINLTLHEMQNIIYFNQDIFEFVFRNVYHNAIKFTPEGGNISIFSKSDNSRCSVVIKDNGVGMDDTEIDIIMNPSVHFTKNGTNNEKGSGFGLNASIHYLKDYQGSISVSSEKGRGSCFEISFPIGPNTRIIKTKRF